MLKSVEIMFIKCVFAAVHVARVFVHIFLIKIYFLLLQFFPSVTLNTTAVTRILHWKTREQIENGNTNTNKLADFPLI